MVPIVKQICPESRYNIKCPYKRTPDRFVVHNTANDAPAANEINYMINRPEEISFHIAIDDKEIRQALPFERNAWASGDGTGIGNMNGIHIEICYSLSGGFKFIQAEDNAAEYIASQLIERGWGIGKVTKHQDYDGKYCPHRTLDMGWSRFLKMIESYMDKIKKENNTMSEEQMYEQWVKFHNRYEKEAFARAQTPSDWAKEAWAKAVAEGAFDGTSPRSNFTREQAAVVFNHFGFLDK